MKSTFGVGESDLQIAEDWWLGFQGFPKRTDDLLYKMDWLEQPTFKQVANGRVQEVAVHQSEGGLEYELGLSETSNCYRLCWISFCQS